MRRKEFGLLEEQYSVDSWYLWITRLYSAADYYEGEYRLKHGPLSQIERFIGGRYKTKSENFFHPIHASSFGLIPGVTKKPEGEPEFFYRQFYIAVKELIIEWEDYQAEITGYVHCRALEDPIYQSEWFNNADDYSDEGIYQNSNDSKQLLRFVKSPGLRTTNIKIGKEDLEFSSIQLKHCRIDDFSLIEQEIVTEKNCPLGSRTYLQVLREHHLELEIRQLFDNDLIEKTLPIQNAHITVEIYLQ